MEGCVNARPKAVGGVRVQRGQLPEQALGLLRRQRLLRQGRKRRGVEAVQLHPRLLRGQRAGRHEQLRPAQGTRCGARRPPVAARKAAEPLEAMMRAMGALRHLNAARRRARVRVAP